MLQPIPTTALSIPSSNMILCALWCWFPQGIPISQPYWGTYLPLGEWPLPMIQWCCALHCANHQICYGICRQIGTCSPIYHCPEMVPHCRTHIDMGWPQPKSPIQTEDSTAEGVVNNTIVPHMSKMMDMCFWWLRCRASQNQFRYYWDAGSKNWADYNIKHHPDTYHESHRSTHADIWNWVGTWSCSLHQTIGPRVFPQGFSHKDFPFLFFDTLF